MYQHNDLTNGRWNELTIIEQMANIGAEVGRAINWKEKDKAIALGAYYRALELLALTIDDPKNINRLGEICRVKEMFGDWFLGINEYRSTAEEWEKYFYQFNYAARLNR